MKKAFLCMLLLLALQLCPSAADAAELEKHGVSLTPQTTVDGRVYSAMDIDIFGDANLAEVQFVKIDTKTYVDFFRENVNIGHFTLNTDADYLFYKANLRDDIHEELIGIGFSANPTYPGKYNAKEIFIIGLNDEGQIVRLPILIYDRPKEKLLGNAPWDMYRKFIMSQNVEVEGKTVQLRSDIANWRPPIHIYWSWEWQGFVIDDSFGLYD